MVKRLMEIRLSKYDPKYRRKGNYAKDDWTAVSDIGKVFDDGTKFTKRQYRECEQRYVDCILELLRRCGQDRFNITSYEKHSFGLRSLLCSMRLDRKLRITKWKDKQILEGKGVELFIRDCLRENCWGKLENKTTYIHFGYDYYVYIGVDLPPACVACTVDKYGLFFEVMKSPYSSD